MYLDYDTAPAHIKARLVRASSMSVKDRSRLYSSHALEKKGVIASSKYNGFLYQKKAKPLKTRQCFLTKSALSKTSKKS